MPTRVIGFFSQKGGSGKSTLATHSAVIAAERYRVALADADPQHNARDWGKTRPFDTPKVLEMTPSNARKIVEAANSDGIDFLYVDFPPHASPAVADLVSLMDFVVVPCQPTPPDYLTLARSVAILQAHRVPFAFVVNRLARRASESRRAGAWEVLGSYGEVCPNSIADLTAYADSWGYGQAVTEYAPGSAAADDMRKVCGWIEQRITSGVAA
jgi:chromosome partitioning protein